MKILAIDFGLKNIGLAISEGKLAEPFGQLKIKNKSDLFEQLKKISSSNKIERVVLGLPEGHLAPLVKKFGKDLRHELDIPLIFQDETLTSQEAREKMVEAGKPLKKRQKEEHVVSACLILQSYLDQLDQAK